MKRLLLMACLSLVACGDDDEPRGGVITLGSVIDRTGNNAEPSYEDSVQLAVNHVNTALRRAGLGGVQFALVAANSENDPVVAVDRMRELVRDHGAKALVLDTTQNAEAANMLFYDADPENDLGVPLTCVGCTSGNLNNPNDMSADPVLRASRHNEAKWLSRCLMSTASSSLIINRLIRNETGDVNGDGFLKIAGYGSPDSFGTSTLASVARSANSVNADRVLAGTVSVEQILHANVTDPLDLDLEGDLARLLDGRNETTGAMDGAPDVVVMASFAGNHAAFTRYFIANAAPIPLIHFHTMRLSRTLTELGTLAEGQQGVAHVVIAGASGELFRDLYREAFLREINWRDANYYDAAVTFLLATVMAQREVEDPTQVDPGRIRDLLPCTSARPLPFLADCPNGGADATQVVPGPEGLQQAIELIVSGAPIDYVGASGPVDFDVNRNVRNDFARFIARGGRYIDADVFDCVSSDACAPIPQ